MDWYTHTEWNQQQKGLRKQVLDIKFSKLEKPHQVSTVIININEVFGLNGRDSKYLGTNQMGKNQQFKMGTALTPVDCYIEMLVRQMILGERARCYIHTRSTESEDIIFVVTLEGISQTREIHKLDVKEMYELALSYKENGVAMFKKYPLFAHDYFVRSAKCLISYKPFDNLTLKQDGVAASDMEALFTQIQTNLAACLLTQDRYEDVIYQTQFVENSTEPSEKSVYRRAKSFFYLKEFEKAQKTLKKIPNYMAKKEFAELHERIVENWKTTNDQYKNVVQRMFS